MRNSFVICFVCIFIFLTGPAFSRSEQKWLLVQTPVFTIISAADEKETLEWAVKLEQFRRGLQLVTGVSDETLLPATVVIFRNDNDFEPFKLRRPDGSHQNVAGYFLTDDDHGFVAFSCEHQGAGMQQLIFHEGTHWFLHPVAGKRPGWLEEGLAEVFSTFELKDGYMSFGQPLPLHLFLLHHESLQPVAALVATNTRSLPYKEDMRTGMFYAQSWLLAHYLIFGKESPNAGRLGYCLTLFAQDTSLDQIFEQAFGCDYNEMDKRLSRYLGGGSFSIFKVPVKAEDFTRDITIRPASAADVAIALGDLMAGVGDDAQAKLYIDRAVAAAPGDPRVIEIMAQHALRDGQYDEAVSRYEQAAGAGSKNFRVWAFLADHYMHEAGLYVSLATADPAKARKAADCYEQAIRLSPLYPHMYRQLAETMGTLVQFSDDDGDILRKGLGLVPNDSMMTAGLAAWEIKNGHAEAGRQHLQALLNSSQTSTRSSRIYAQWLLTEMGRAEAEKKARDLFQQGNAGEAGTILDGLLNGHRSMPSDERARLINLRAKMGAYEILQRAQQLADAHQPDFAKALLDGLLENSNLDAGVRTQAQTLMDKLK